MKPYFQNYNVNDFLSDAWQGILVAITDKGLIAIALSAYGFMAVLTYNSDITIDFIMITAVAYVIMTVLGVWKHVKADEFNLKVFLVKTVTEFTVMFAVIVIGYLFGIAIFILRKIAGRIGFIDMPTEPTVGMYFIYAGYMICFTYHTLKSLDLIDQLMPDYVPAWFSATFRRFRKTGEFADLLKTPVINSDINPQA